MNSGRSEGGVFNDTQRDGEQEDISYNLEFPPDRGSPFHCKPQSAQETLIACTVFVQQIEKIAGFEQQASRTHGMMFSPVVL
jgi:hypothetical protein